MLKRTLNNMFGVYIKFLFSSIVHKISFWLILFFYVAIFSMYTYLIPYLLNYPLNRVVVHFTILFVLIILIACCSSCIASNIFRSGIDDGSEILFVSKPISRTQIVLAKFLVMLIVYLIQSTLVAIVPVFSIFYRYGVSNPLPYVGGYFILLLIVSLFFSSLTILFSLKLKKMESTLLSTGLAVLLCIFSIINVFVNKIPGFYNKKDGYRIRSRVVYTNDNKSTELVRHNFYSLYYNHELVTPQTTNNNGENIFELAKKNNQNLINYVYQQSFNQSKWKNTVKFDPFFQWLFLFNLANFYYQQDVSPHYNNPIYNFADDDVPTNTYYTFSDVNYKFNELTINGLVSDNDSNNYIGVVTYNQNIYCYNPQDEKDRMYINLDQLESKYDFIYIPYFEYDTNGIITNSLKFLVYENPMINPNAANDIFNDLINSTDSSDNKNDISYANLFTAFNLFKKLVDQSNNILLKQYYKFNNFMTSYYFNCYEQFWNNVVNNPNKNIDFVYRTNVENNLSVTYKQAYDKLISLQPYMQMNKNYSDIDQANSYFSYNNIDTTNNLISLAFRNIELIQTSIANYLEQQVDSTNQTISYTDNKTYIDLILPYTTEDNQIMLTNVEMGNNFYKLLKNNLNSSNQIINNVINNSLMLANMLPLELSNFNNLISNMSSVQIHYYLHFWPLFMSWLLICLFLLAIAICLYAKKDFK